MTGKRAENPVEMGAYIEARSLLGLKPVHIHREVCDIYREGQMSHRSVCRWVAKFKAGRPQTTTTKSNIKKFTELLNQDVRYTVRDLARLEFIAFKRTPETQKNKCKLDTTFVNR